MTQWACIGIDGGLQGAIVAINEGLEVLAYVDMPKLEMKRKGKVKRGKNVGKPTIKISRSFDVRGLWRELKSLIDRLKKQGYHPLIFLEEAHAMPRQGLSSTFVTGRGFGLAEMACVANDVPYQIVKASDWTKDILKGIGGEQKERSMKQASRLFPSLPIVKPTGGALDGRADAVLIAYYGLTKVPNTRQVTEKPIRTPIKKG